jgi:NAD/NADP transhydrogenase alpha subunit
MEFRIPAKTRADATRFAATPETKRKRAASAHYTVIVQSGAGAGIPDGRYIAAAWV